MGPDPADSESRTPLGSPTVGAFRVLVVVILLLAWVGRAVLGPFVVAGVVAYAFSPLVSAAQRRLGWPRPVIVAIWLVGVLVVLGSLIYLIAGQAAREFEHLAAAGPDALAVTLRQLVGSDSIAVGSHTISAAAVGRELQAAIGGLFSAGEAIQLARSVGEGALKTVLALIVSFYFLVDGGRFLDRAVALLPAAYRPRTVALLAEIHLTLGRWLRGQLLLVALVTVVVYLILGPILGLHYALAIGLLTGILEVLPLVGPIIAATIATVVAISQGGLSLAVIVLVVYVVLRQVEDQVVMPVVIGRAVHLHPVVTIFAVLVGLNVYGILGGLLGVPAAAAINVVFQALYPTSDGADQGGVDRPALPAEGGSR